MTSTTTSASDESEQEDTHDVPYRCEGCGLSNVMKYDEERNEAVCEVCCTTESGVFLPDYNVRTEQEADIVNINPHGPQHERPNYKRDEYKHTTRPIKYGAFPKVQHVEPINDEDPVGPYEN